MAQAPRNVPPCGRADTLLGLQEAKELGSTWGAGQRGVGAEFSQGRVRENRGPVLSRTASIQQGLEQLGARAKGPEEGGLGGKCALCVLGSCTPYSPSTMTSRAEMTASSCRALGQGRGEIQSEGGHSPAPAWSGEENCVCCGSLLPYNSWWLGSRSQGW